MDIVFALVLLHGSVRNTISLVACKGHRQFHQRDYVMMSEEEGRCED